MRGSVALPRESHGTYTQCSNVTEIRCNYSLAPFQCAALIHSAYILSRKLTRMQGRGAILALLAIVAAVTAKFEFTEEWELWKKVLLSNWLKYDMKITVSTMIVNISCVSLRLGIG